jgi:hypothetical protein
LIGGAEDVTGASVAAGEDVTWATAGEEADVAGGKDEAGASVAKVEDFRRLRIGSEIVIVDYQLTTINFIGTISTFWFSIAIDNT